MVWKHINVTRFLSLAFILSAIGATLRTAAQGVPSDAKINGVVFNQSTKEPFKGVRVTITRENGGPQLALTDDSGKFTFRNLVAGRYRIALEFKGFTEPSHSRGPRNISLGASEELKDVHIEM